MNGQLSLTFTAGDRKRLGKQLLLVKGVVVGAGWLTLARISELTGAPEASVSARLRGLRKLGFTVETCRAGPDRGTWLYRVTA